MPPWRARLVDDVGARSRQIFAAGSKTIRDEFMDDRRSAGNKPSFLQHSGNG
jgi:hypothetical protein